MFSREYQTHELELEISQVAHRHVKNCASILNFVSSSEKCAELRVYGTGAWGYHGQGNIFETTCLLDRPIVVPVIQMKLKSVLFCAL